MLLGLFSYDVWAESYIEGYIKRVDGGSIITDSINKPFYFEAQTDTEIMYMEYLGPHETVWVEYPKNMIIDESFTNGKYTFRAYDTYGNMTEKHIYYDTVKPIGKFYVVDEIPNNSSIDAEYFYFEASDELSGLDMVYIKKPNTNKYVSYTYNTYLYEAGTYYFYATDYAGNVSKTYQITLNGNPMVDIVYNNENNTVYLTWEKTDYLVYVNDIKYQKESIFCDEGSYNIKVIDGMGRIGEETFIIDHLYKYVKTIWPTCMKEGYILYSCITCKKELEEINKEKIDHSYAIELIAPTCIEPGYSLKTCTMCQKEEKIITSDPLGHNLIEITRNVTCEEDGGKFKKCSNCSYEIVIEQIKAQGHNYTSKIIKPATCLNEGIREFTCDKCLDTYQKNIKALEHNFILIEEVIHNLEEVKQKELIYKCHNCGEKLSRFENLTTNDMETITSVFKDNSSVLIIILIVTSSLWSVFMGIKFIIARNRNEKVEAKRHIMNYILGLIVIFSILVIGPLIIDGIRSIL